MLFPSRSLSLGLIGSLGLLIVSRSASAEPMHLSDPHPRWVSVRFEASPEEEPGRLDKSYGGAIPAWLEPDRALGRVRVTIPARWVESRLLAEQGARPGALSDFTWLFDVRTGDVVSASLSGVLVRRVGLGPFRFDTDVEIRGELTTLAPAGFRSPDLLFGQRIFAYCDPAEGASCTPVRAVPYDPRTGYVNAVGFLSGRAAHLTTRSFSPLGEARIEEMKEPTLLGVEWDSAAWQGPAVSAPAPAAASSALPATPTP